MNHDIELLRKGRTSQSLRVPFQPLILVGWFRSALHDVRQELRLSQTHSNIFDGELMRWLQFSSRDKIIVVVTVIIFPDSDIIVPIGLRVPSSW